MPSLNKNMHTSAELDSYSPSRIFYSRRGEASNASLLQRRLCPSSSSTGLSRRQRRTSPALFTQKNKFCCARCRKGFISRWHRLCSRKPEALTVLSAESTVLSVLPHAVICSVIFNTTVAHSRCAENDADNVRDGNNIRNVKNVRYRQDQAVLYYRDHRHETAERRCEVARNGCRNGSIQRAVPPSARFVLSHSNIGCKCQFASCVQWLHFT